MLIKKKVKKNLRLIPGWYGELDGRYLPTHGAEQMLEFEGKIIYVQSIFGDLNSYQYYQQDECGTRWYWIDAWLESALDYSNEEEITDA